MGSKYSIHSFDSFGCVGGSSCCYLIGVLPVPLVQQVHVVAHGHQRLPQQLQLRRVDLRGDRAVAVPRVKYYLLYLLYILSTLQN